MAAGSQPISRLLDTILPGEIQKPMPNAALQEAQRKALAEYWRFVKLADLKQSEQRAAQLL